MNNMKTINLFISIILIFIVLSCKTSKIANQTPLIKKEVPFIQSDNVITDSIISKMASNQFDFEWFSAKFTADYEIDKNNTSFSGQIRIRKDSIIWISISKFSIEGLRIKITQDSVFVINRLEDNYFQSDFNYINKFINNAIDFDMLQAFIIGNDFKYYENDKFKTSVDNNYFHLETVNRHKLKKYIKTENDRLKILVQSILIDSKTYKIKSLTVKEVKENNKLKISYDNFELINDKLFPKSIQISILSAKEININIEYSKIYKDEPLTFPFKIPESYERLIPN